MSQYQYRFTVFTPTYNRAYTIHLVFNSLMKQSYKNFEWLIVDDGSTDNTQKIIEEFQQKVWFPIRYIRQRNGGKHRAINRGVKEARGEFFLIFDSDDWCVENALERFEFHWSSLSEYNKKKFASIVALTKDKKGHVIGDKFPEDIFDSNWVDISFKHNIKGDKWLLFKTDILKKYPFPEYEGERFIAESSVWNEIAKRYQTRGINEALLIHEYLSDGLTSKSQQLRKESIQGTMYTYTNQLRLKISFKYKVKAVVNCMRFTIYNKRLFAQCIKSIVSLMIKKEKTD